MLISLDNLQIGARFLQKLPSFLRHPLRLDEARAILRGRLERREADFLALVHGTIYANPASPYRQLLAMAGCEYGDLERLVQTDGLEGALRHLLQLGVYLTVDEYKGRRPVRRGSVALSVDPGQLRNPWSACHVPVRTGGSRSGQIPALIDLAFVRDCAVNVLLWLEARGALASAKAHWQFPQSGATARLLEYASFSPPVRWFSPIDPATPEMLPLYRLSAMALRWGSRLAGVPLPRPEYVPFADPLPIVRWMAQVLAAGGMPHLHTWPSYAVRLCQVAAGAGLDLTGAQFTVVGEPITEARLAVVRRVGARAWARYGSVESGGIGYACLAPRVADEVHLLEDCLAVIQPGAEGEAHALPAAGLFMSSLRATAPLVFLNVSLGDQATVDRRPCGCALHQLGWTTRLHTIRSYEKLTAGGVTFLDTDVIRVLEEVLPARFGGGPTDYQLVEEQDAEDGHPRLRLLVRPEIGPLDPELVASSFLDAIGPGEQGERLMALRWRDAKLLRVDRQAPLTTPTGKILHLHVTSRGSPGSATRP